VHRLRSLHDDGQQLRVTVLGCYHAHLLLLCELECHHGLPVSTDTLATDSCASTSSRAYTLHTARCTTRGSRRHGKPRYGRVYGTEHSRQVVVVHGHATTDAVQGQSQRRANVLVFTLSLEVREHRCLLVLCRRCRTCRTSNIADANASDEAAIGVAIAIAVAVADTDTTRMLLAGSHTNANAHTHTNTHTDTASTTSTHSATCA
jgi:hypothetical protein